jgi:hypothetical protein
MSEKTQVQVPEKGWVTFDVSEDPRLQHYLAYCWEQWGGSVALSQMQEELENRFNFFPGHIISDDEEGRRRLGVVRQSGFIIYPLEKALVYHG